MRNTQNWERTFSNQLAAVFDRDRRKRFVALADFGFVENVDDRHARNDASKHDVLAVQVRRAVRRGDDVKLRA